VRLRGVDGRGLELLVLIGKFFYISTRPFSPVSVLCRKVLLEINWVLLGYLVSGHG
jgi:hypothetical protein